MIFQILVTVFLALVIAYGAGSTAGGPLVRVGIAVTGLVAIVIVWVPDMSTQIANVVGIGRGADFVFYLWMVISFALFIRISIQLRNLQQHLTRLARAAAIESALAGGRPSQVSGDQVPASRPMETNSL